MGKIWVNLPTFTPALTLNTLVMFTLFSRFRRKTSLRQLLTEFNRSLMLIADRQLLVDNFLAKVRQLLAVERANLFLPDENTEKYRLCTGSADSSSARRDRQEPCFSGRGKLVSWLAVNERPLTRRDRQRLADYLQTDELTLLDSLQAAVVCPLHVMNRISGILVIGPRRDGKPFSRQDMDVLDLLAGQAAFAIEHASLYEVQRDRLKRMYRTDRLAVLGELAAGAAHEIKNPLTAIRSTIQYLSADYPPQSEKGRLMSELLEETGRIDKTVRGLLSFARPTELNTAEVDLEQLINQSLLLTGNTLKKHGVEVEFEYFTDHTTLQGDAEQLKQVFLNLLLNAVEAMKDNPPERPRTLYISLEPGTPIDARRHYLLLSFEDTGCGISEQDLDNVFNPFFTTKPEGTGLGLAICYGIIRRHGGEIEVSSTPGRGTCFTLKLVQADFLDTDTADKADGYFLSKNK